MNRNSDVFVVHGAFCLPSPVSVSQNVYSLDTNVSSQKFQSEMLGYIYIYTQNLL